MASDDQPQLVNPLSASDASPNETDIVAKSASTITLPRNVVYFQAAMLGLIATTFFIFGLMVGSLTSNNGFEPETVSCEVDGQVVFLNNGTESPDAGAVVMMVSSSRRPSERMDPTAIHPESFVPLDNDVITTIHQLGGAIVRADEQGRFNFEVDSPGKYELIVISKNQASDAALTKRQRAAISTYFIPVEKLHDKKAIHDATLKIDGKRKKLGQIQL